MQRTSFATPFWHALAGYRNKRQPDLARQVPRNEVQAEWFNVRGILRDPAAHASKTTRKRCQFRHRRATARILETFTHVFN